jgi:hypothetical protein
MNPLGIAEKRFAFCEVQPAVAVIFSYFDFNEVVCSAPLLERLPCAVRGEYE